MDFTKMQGAGNDFIVVEAANLKCDWAQLARAMCDRHFGIGADGLLLALPSDIADIRMRMFNPDGSEAEACGNGLRCLVKYAAEGMGLLEDTGAEMSVETMAGVRQAKLFRTGEKLTKIQVSLGQPEFKAKYIPATVKAGEGDISADRMISYPVVIAGRQLVLNLVSMGNPHAVHFVAEPVAEFPLFQIGPEIENLNVFPNRVNFETARVINSNKIEVRVWERGAGETPACGSGAGAVAVAAQLKGYVGSVVDIMLPGGILTVEWDGAGEVLLSGPAEAVYNGEWPK
ncbi:MAG: diaminopimelate epimerase [Chloroflexota bacterium]